MDATDFDLVFQALAERKVRYLVVGGVAVVLHGHPRLTSDIDIVLAMDHSNILAAMGALGSLGYRPRAPVPAEAFADPAIRGGWIADKGLTVFSMWSPEHPATEIDLFVEEPFPFDNAYARALHANLSTTEVTVASIEDLIALKTRAARAKDLEDVRALRAIAEEQNG